jgi:hypothetical protein
MYLIDHMFRWWSLSGRYSPRLTGLIWCVVIRIARSVQSVFSGATTPCWRLEGIRLFLFFDLCFTSGHTVWAT